MDELQKFVMQVIQFREKCCNGSVVGCCSGVVGVDAVIVIAFFGCMFILVTVSCVAVIVIIAGGASGTFCVVIVAVIDLFTVAVVVFGIVAVGIGVVIVIFLLKKTQLLKCYLSKS